VTIRDSEGRKLLSEVSGQPLLSATKCDLCVDEPAGPACVNACAHDALRRVDLSDWSQLAPWLRK
jgi:Fe-S-cluster-containing hydrogenase component 2